MGTIKCHASGDKCLGCKHYRGEADQCEFAPPEDWYPIETAPKDKVLLLFGVSDLWENGAVQNWKMETGFWQDGAECWRWEGRQVRKYDTQPTHWRPLPDPPMLYRSVKCQTP